MTPRTWTCTRTRAGIRCGTINPRVKQRCPVCGGPRPKRRRPKHRAVLDAMPYEAWVEQFGEVCGVCGRAPSARRRLDRDHWHAGPHAGEARGLACARCNRALPSFVTSAWLRAAADYLDRAAARGVVGTGQGETAEEGRSLNVYTLSAGYFLAVVVAANEHEALAISADPDDYAGWRFLGHDEADVDVELVPLDAPAFIESHSG